MDWALTFYKKQAEWSDIYRQEVTAHHRAKARKAARTIGEPPKVILELGAGAGQDAVALAELKYDVIALEREPLLVAHIQQLINKHKAVNVRVIQGNFYDVAFLHSEFDAICYWDGFGIGTDEEQRCLLRRMHRWMKEEGFVFVDVYTPWHAAKSTGYKMEIGKIKRTYDFDGEQCRWLDEWQFENERVVQTLRCYSPADMRLLLQGTGLELVDIWAGGMMDYDGGRFYAEAPLEKAMWYTAILKKEDPA